MSDNTTQNGAKTTHPIAAIILFVMLALGSFHLKTSGFVGEASFVSLLTVSGIFGFIVYFQDRIKKAGATGLELYEAVKEVRDAEASVKTLAASVLELAEASEDGSMKFHGWDESRYMKAKNHLKELTQ